jgi:hypothetical protein
MSAIDWQPLLPLREDEQCRNRNLANDGAGHKHVKANRVDALTQEFMKLAKKDQSAQPLLRHSASRL